MIYVITYPWNRMPHQKHVYRMKIGSCTECRCNLLCISSMMASSAKFPIVLGHGWIITLNSILQYILACPFPRYIPLAPIGQNDSAIYYTYCMTIMCMGSSQSKTMYCIPHMWFGCYIVRFCCNIQSSADITRSNIVRYCINNCRNSGRMSIRCWISQKTSHTSP